MEFCEIKDAFEDAGFNVRSYSGRGMYGRECLGVVTDTPSAGVVCRVIQEYINNSGLEADEMVDGIADLCSALEDPSEDSMGLSSIVYWPSVKWEKSDSDDSEDDSDE